MSTRHSTNRFTQLINNLLKTRLRIDGILDNIILLISISKTTNTSRIDRNMLYSIFQSQNDIIKILKLSIIVQKAIVQGYVPDCDKLVQILLTKVDDASSQHIRSEGVKFIKEKIVRPYLNYLQKRIFQNKNIYNFQEYIKQAQIMTLEEQSAKIEKFVLQNINIDKKKQIQIKFDKPTYYNFSNTIQANLSNKQSDQKQLKIVQKLLYKCFYLINLLKKCVYICPSMVIMIRYYGGYYGCILDFNIVLAIDVEIIYYQLSQSIKQVDNYLKKIQKFPKFKEIKYIDNVIKQLQDIRIMIKQIQVIHQAIQLIYYNCYHYKNLTNYAPKLINTQKYFSKIQDIKKQYIRQLKWNKISSQIRSLSFQYKQQQCNLKMLNSLNNTPKDHRINNRSTYRKINLNKSHYIQQNRNFKPIAIVGVRQQMILQPEQQTNKIQYQNTTQKQTELIDQITITASTYIKSSRQKSNEEQVAKQEEKDIFEFVESQNQSQHNIQDNLDQQCQNSKMCHNITLLLEMSRIFQDMNKIKLAQNI